jgi:hypothetical protein
VEELFLMENKKDQLIPDKGEMKPHL